MDVTIEPHVANVRTPDDKGRLVDKVIKYEQYRVRVDGMTAGYIGFQPGSKVLLINRYTPDERVEIERQVATLVGADSVDSSQAPEVPADPQDEDLDVGDDLGGTT